MRSLNPNIKIELKWDRREIAFLDTLVKLVDGKLETSLYSKPTDKHTYLHIKSEHPSSVKKAIPYGLAIRLKRISSSDEDYQKENWLINVKMPTIHIIVGKLTCMSRIDFVLGWAERGGGGGL